MGLIKQSLYSIADSFLEIERMVNDGEIKPEDIIDQIEAMEGEFRNKAVQVATIRQNIKPVIDMVDIEIKRLNARKKALQNRSDNLSDYLSTNMAKIKETHIKHDLFTITLCKGREVLIIDNEEDIDDEFINIEVISTIDKKLLTAKLKEQAKIPCISKNYDPEYKPIEGAHIERADNFIRIK